MVKAYRNFVEQMSDHDDLLQSVCWTVPVQHLALTLGREGDGRLRYFALCCYVYMYHFLAAPPPPHVWSWIHAMITF